MKRIISGTCYVLLVTLFFVLREFVDYRIFDLFLWFLCAVGTFEIARAYKNYLSNSSYIVAILYGIIFVPLFVLANKFLNAIVLAISLGIIVVYLLVQVVICMSVKNAKGGGILTSVLTALYPAIFILVLLLANEMSGKKGFVALLLTFVISPFSDTFAFVAGSLIGGKKLCPKLSPKKTWSGAIGGVIGGAIGALLINFIFAKGMIENLGWVYFIIVGIFASILTIIGDLFESFLKRKVDIKDMGKIMPGHGGVLDRIDGLMFAGAFIYLAVFII